MKTQMGLCEAQSRQRLHYFTYFLCVGRWFITMIIDCLPGDSQLFLTFKSNWGHELVEHGASRVSKVVYGAATIMTGLISDH